MKYCCNGNRRRFYSPCNSREISIVQSDAATRSIIEKVKAKYPLFREI